MNIYYDETNHSRIVGPSKKNIEKITFDTNTESEFLYGFIAFKDESCFEEKYLGLEREYRNSINFPEKKELKSRTIYKGQSFHKMHESKVVFIESLFKLMSEYVEFAQIAAISKLEVYLAELIQRIFHHGVTNWGNNWLSFGAMSFSFIKFIDTIPDHIVYNKLRGEMSFSSCANFIKGKLVIAINESILMSQEHIDKRKAFSNMIDLLDKAIMNCDDATVTFKKEWDYSLIPRTLNVPGLAMKDIFWKIDREENVERAVKEYGYNYEPVISKNNPCSRAVDIYIGFFRMLAIDTNLITNSEKQDVNYVTKYNNWYFSMDQRKYNIIKQYGKILGTNHYAITTLTCSKYSLIPIAILNMARESEEITKTGVAAQHEHFINKVISEIYLGE